MAENVKTAEGGKGKEGGKAKGGKAGGKGEAVLSPNEVQVARMLVRALWAQEMIAANPEQTAADRAAAWKDIRQARNEAELKKVRRALLTLKRAGVVMKLSEKAAKSAEDVDAGAEAEA